MSGYAEGHNALARTVEHRLNALADWHEKQGTSLPPHEMRALAVSLGTKMEVA